ncbi:signal peptide peptidase SppA [Nitrosomonas communis]|uniref:signal peptide peptidase SppA n=1 Tax=Nitrosomonas communis TaxID=44574 RepID=UPI003D26DC89
MRIIDVLTSPWAIVPGKLTEIHSIYNSHLAGEKVDLEAVALRIGKPLANESQGYEINQGVAIIPIHGVIAKKMNMFSDISGGASTELIARDIRDALANPEVNSILLHIDSPGGTVDGTQALADLVRQARDIKPVVSFVDGLMASAAYWIGSAASEIIASSGTDQIGSIGVAMTHTDTSKAQEMRGVKTTDIFAGKYKRIASGNSPLSEEGQAHLQDQVDQLYTIFVDAVAENRDVDSEHVLSQMADGRVFLSKDAVQRGLIDRIATLDTTIFNLSTGVWPVTTTAGNKGNTTVASSPVVPPVEPVKIELSVEKIKAEYPGLAQALIMEGEENERKRIKAIEGALIPGHEAIVSAMKFDGVSTAGDVALAIVAAENKIRSDKLADLKSNAPDPVKTDPVNAIDKPKDKKADDASLPLEERAKAAWDSDANLRSEFSSFGSYFSFVEANGGKL